MLPLLYLYAQGPIIKVLQMALRAAERYKGTWRQWLGAIGVCAAIAVFLAQDSSKGITGQAINIDGGGVMS